MVNHENKILIFNKNDNFFTIIFFLSFKDNISNFIIKWKFNHFI